MKNLETIRKAMSPERRRRISARASEILAEEMTLRELRKALSHTQARVGETLGIGQEGVSRLEQRSDFLLSTLRSYVEAMGGSLTLVAQFPGHQPVALLGIRESGIREVNAPRAASSRPRRSQARG